MEDILRDSYDDDSNDGGFDESLLQPTEITPDRSANKSSTPTNAKEQLSFLLREQKVLQEASRLHQDYYKRDLSGGNTGERMRNRTKSPINAVGFNQTLSKFKSIDLNLIQALGNKKQPSTTSLQRSTSANYFLDQ